MPKNSRNKTDWESPQQNEPMSDDFITLQSRSVDMEFLLSLIAIISRFGHFFSLRSYEWEHFYRHKCNSISRAIFYPEFCRCTCLMSRKCSLFLWFCCLLFRVWGLVWVCRFFCGF